MCFVPTGARAKAPPRVLSRALIVASLSSRIAQLRGQLCTAARSCAQLRQLLNNTDVIARKNCPAGDGRVSSQPNFCHHGPQIAGEDRLPVQPTESIPTVMPAFHSAGSTGGSAA